ncbi:MAG: hypothetical protein AAF961_09140, partial [Planctomycetota bacterium]
GSSLILAPSRRRSDIAVANRGCPRGALYNHVAPPNWNGVDCGRNVPDTPGEPAVVSARSSHPGIVKVSFGDARADGISDDVDLVVWRAMGSRNGGEIVPGE